MKEKNSIFMVVGAGLTGAVIARSLADGGYRCVVIEKSDHVAGNCHTMRDLATGILMHCYGPHTLHSDNNEVWDFVSRFAEIRPYIHRKQAWVNDVLYPFPVNLTALKMFFGRQLDEARAAELLAGKARPYATRRPRNFEEAALAAVGPEIYHGFYRGYTKKQWGRDPATLPTFFFKRIPVHFDDKRDVFHHEKQGQPVNGYTDMVEKMLDHERIEIRLDCEFSHEMFTPEMQHLFFSGPLDEYFGWCFGRLPYRTLDFKFETMDGTFQQCGTVNYCDESVPFTRIFEHKHFWPWEPQNSKTIITYEFPRECGPGDRQFYPVNLDEAQSLCKKYETLANGQTRVSFVGRLGSYRYLDMDKAIEEALHAARVSLRCIGAGLGIPAFFSRPDVSFRGKNAPGASEKSRH